MARARRPRGRKGAPTVGKQRSHDPESLGSRIFRKAGGETYYVDLRWLGHGRPALRDPSSPGWPSGQTGATTTCEKTATRWAAKYDEHYLQKRDADHQKATGVYRTLKLASEAFLTHRKAQFEESTASGSSTALSHLAEKVGERADPATITARQIQELCDGFLTEGYAVRSVDNTVSHLKMFFDFLEVAENPARAVKLPPPAKEDVQPWSDPQMESIRAAAEAIDLERREDGLSRRKLVDFLYSTGARLMEAAAASIVRFDEEEKTVRIVFQVSRRTGEKKQTKGKEPRTAVVLPEWWEMYDPTECGRLFLRPDGKPFRARKLHDHLVEVLERAGVKEDGEAAHKFRHTYAFHFLQRGGSMDEPSKSLGHKRVSTTQNYYDHFTSDHAARTAAAKIYGNRKSVRRGPRK